MQKLIKWCKGHSLKLATLLLLAFIPLYPKLPLLDIKHTWVYIRVEDFLVLFVLLWWGILFVRQKVTLKTPLTIPIFLFWIIGAIATIHGMLLIFPSLSGVFANVSFLSFIRRIEYMSVFFIAFSAMKDRKSIVPVIVTVVGTVLLVSLYGLGQKYMGLPAYLTMNEEFAKGTPLTLSSLSRISSTFAGHYDLAAYYVLVLPIIASLIFGYTNWLVRAILAGIVILGVVVLFMTVSRISFFALVFSLAVVLFFQRRKVVLMLLPFLFIAGIFFVANSVQLINRFGSTIRSIDVIVDAKTGNPVGHVKEVPRSYFADKQVWQRFYLTIGDLATKSSPSASFVIPNALLPESAVLLVEPSAPTGEDLPSGTGYINLTLSPVLKRLENFYYEPTPKEATTAAAVYVINGQYLMKKAFAYDVSFTTRFQGEWPNALMAFKRNVLVGSGYGSVSLAVDNSYLRMLAEVGALGFASFIAIFLIIGVYIVYAWNKIYSLVVKSFVLGFAAGVMGLSINAVFIDVFEASKVAFVLWLLTGVVIGVLTTYHRVPLKFFEELKRMAMSPWAVGMYLLIIVVLLFSQMTRNYFVGDDFTWFRWAADCGNVTDVAARCTPNISKIIGYFTNSEGFFYRPGTKLYFLFMYQFAWLNQSAYHSISLVLHYIVSILVFLVGVKVFKRKLHATLSAFLFVGMSGFSEAIFWVSATGFLFTSGFMLISLLLYIAWSEKKKTYLAFAAAGTYFFAMMFHELGVVTPMLYVLYQYTIGEGRFRLSGLKVQREHWIMFFPLPFYALIRFISHSLWFNGDYSYNLLKLPLNGIGNMLGYFMLSITGSFGLPLYHLMRNSMRDHMALSVFAGLLAVGVLLWVVLIIKHLFDTRDRSIAVFASVFFVIALLPFLGLGNLSPRYGYLASVGVVFLLVFGLELIYRIAFHSGKDVAISVVTICVSVFFMMQITSVQQLHRDWYEAGEKVRTFFVSMESHYEDNWAIDSMQFHFVDVPIRYRDAWVFPVGLSDALWFVTHNPNGAIYSWPTVDEALARVTPDSPTQKIFVFGDQGDLTEVKKESVLLP